LAVTLGTLSLLLAAAGIFGLTAYMVSTRTREIGVRMALGGSRRSVFVTVVRGALSAVIWGACAGLLLSVILSSILRASMTVADAPDILYGVSPFDFAAFAAVLLFITAVALCAAYLPARRAMKIDPMAALRYE
jgi:ABC-type antimicrobial peptide transport system permease subunit